MMKTKTEGTLVLEGMIEGPVLSGLEMERRLHDWTDQARRRGVKFSVEVEGERFNVLAPGEAIAAETLSEPPETIITSLLSELLELFPQPLRTSLFSTLRCSEYSSGSEIQTIFGIAPPGEIRACSRTVDASTTPRAIPLTRKDRLKLALVGLGVVVAVLLVSSLFVDYRSLLSGAKDRLLPFDVERLEVQAGTFADYFTVAKKDNSQDHRAVAMTLKRTAAFPRSDADVDKLLEEKGSAAPARLAVEALAQGYVRCEMFNRKGEYVGYAMTRIVPLRSQDDLTIEIAIPTSRDLGRVVITY